MDSIDFKGFIFKPLTGATMSVLMNVKSPVVTGGENAIEALLDYAFVSSQPIADVLKASREDWQLAVLTFGEQFTQDELTELGEIMSNDLTKVEESHIETKEDSKKKK